MPGNSPLKNTSRGGWKSAIFIIFVEVAERFAYYGVAGNLMMYLTRVLGQPTATAAKNVNIWEGVSAVFPVVGGFLADSYVGRFRTILLASTIYLIGLVLLTVAVSAVPPRAQGTLFFIALYVLAIGEGGHKPCVQTFAADQFDEGLPEEKAAKSSFFNWWYVGIVCGATAAVLVVIYVEDYVGWKFGFGMLVVAVAAALVVFLIGSRSYRRQAPVGSPFTRVAQVVVAAVRKRRLAEGEGRGIFVEEDGGTVHPLARTSQFRFLDKATMIDDKDTSTEKRNPWRLCSSNQVEEVKLLLQLIPIWFSCLMFAVVTAQLGTYFTKQGSTMVRTITPTFHIPPASFQVFTGLTILASVLLYERALVPIARAITGRASGITILQRIGTGLVLSILAMAVAASVEAKRVNIARDNGLVDEPKSVVPMAIWWLVPQYVICGLSDVFTVVGLQELFYDQMPVEMRSVGAAAYISVIGIGSFLSSGLICIVQGVSSRGGHEWLGDNINRANLEYFYWVLAALSAVNLCGYVCLARRFVYKSADQGGFQGRSGEKELE
ncbi:protein NRT1/ PTR FAMILY 5.4-like [Sesamum indicum]|uniref:Protein NRT1/ PTR FAMILY 5.4-like n=1 Tax=Sesamum indicum TaxID=4182 RepID=A0A6I9TX74_SESIN|nr:protein NRT1/ PTR FAMILY 5.4-like [Sesamum indicum]